MCDFGTPSPSEVCTPCLLCRGPPCSRTYKVVASQPQQLGKGQGSDNADEIHSLWPGWL